MLASAAGVKMLHVPYRGGAPALNDLIAGHVNTLFVSPVIGLANIQAGKLKALALAAPKRLEILPDLITMEEAGYPVDASYWFGLVAPAGTPPAVIAKLEKALAEVLSDAGRAQAAHRDGRCRDAARRQGVRRLHPDRDREVGGIVARPG